MNKNRIAFCLQVRTLSQRLKRKAFLHINGKFLLQICFDNIISIDNKIDFWVLTSKHNSDNTLCDFLKRKKINYFRGNLLNLVNRYYEFNKIYNYENLVRFTGDNPCPSSSKTKILIKKHLDGKYDYSTNVFVEDKGIGVDIFSKKLIEKANENCNFKQREHLNKYILSNLSNFKTYVPKVAISRKKNLSIDTNKEYILFKGWYRKSDNL